MDGSTLESREEQDPHVRLNIDIPKSLRTRIKVACVREDRKMRDVIIEVLEQRFPPVKL